MMTVKQVSSLTGVSVRTLQFYDEIGLFKPTSVTDSGYRLYDEKALEVLQQILFFKELDFTLKEITAIMGNPHFDKTAAYKKQRELIQMKRDRLNDLLELLGKLIKGEHGMNFREFDMSEYFQMLNDFKKTHTDEIVANMGSAEQFDKMVSEMKSRENEISDMAVEQYGSLEKYTRASQENIQAFLANGSTIPQSEAGNLIDRTETLTKNLVADLTKDVTDPEVQRIVDELVSFVNDCNNGINMGENYWTVMAENYLSNAMFIEVNDRKYGKGASEYIGLALKSFLSRQ